MLHNKSETVMVDSATIPITFNLSNYSKHGIEEISTRLILEYVQLVLYLRSQIPEPVQLMRRKFQKKKPLSSHSGTTQKSKQSEVLYNNKCKQLLKSLDEMKELLVKFVQKSDFVEAVIGVGSTPVSIKEAFTLASRVEDFLPNEEVCSLERINSHARKFCMLMVQSPLCTGGVLPLTNTRLFLRIPNRTAAEGCIPWPNLKWSSKKHKINATINFRLSETSPKPDKSFVMSADSPNAREQDKENRVPQVGSKRDIVNHSFTKSSSSSKESKSGVSSKSVAVAENTAVSRTRLSTAEVLEGVLAENDPISSEEDTNSSESSLQDTKTEGVWLELPVIIKGFKY